MTTSRLAIILFASWVAACSGSQPRHEPRHEPPPDEPAAPQDDDAAACTADADCVASPYFDIDEAGGCCPAIAGPSCVAQVVTVAEAERRRAAWEAQCAAVRCAPSASCATGIWTPAPVCRDGVCVDAARPDDGG